MIQVGICGMGTSLKRRAQIIVEASKDKEVTEENPIDFKEVFDRQKEKMEVRMADTKKDCILYNNTKDSCKGLKKLYCSCDGKCQFYKSEKEYNSDGTNKQGV